MFASQFAGLTGSVEPERFLSAGPGTATLPPVAITPLVRMKLA